MQKYRKRCNPHNARPERNNDLLQHVDPRLVLLQTQQTAASLLHLLDRFRVDFGLQSCFSKIFN